MVMLALAWSAIAGPYSRAGLTAPGRTATRSQKYRYSVISEDAESVTIAVDGDTMDVRFLDDDHVAMRDRKKTMLMTRDKPLEVNLHVLSPTEKWNRISNHDVDKAPPLEKGLYGTPTLPEIAITGPVCARDGAANEAAQSAARSSWETRIR